MLWILVRRGDIDVSVLTGLPPPQPTSGQNLCGREGSGRARAGLKLPVWCSLLTILGPIPPVGLEP
jgi:hypothetical protein